MDAIELVRDTPAERRSDERPDLGGEMPLEAFLTDEPTLDEGPVREQAADAAAPDGHEDVEPAPEPEPEPEPEQPAGEETPPRRSVKKRGGRASVPSWDEIMFGGGKSD